MTKKGEGPQRNFCVKAIGDLVKEQFKPNQQLAVPSELAGDFSMLAYIWDDHLTRSLVEPSWTP